MALDLWLFKAIFISAFPFANLLQTHSISYPKKHMVLCVVTKNVRVLNATTISIPINTLCMRCWMQHSIWTDHQMLKINKQKSAWRLVKRCGLVQRTPYYQKCLCEVQMKNLALCFIFVAMSSCGTIGIVSFNPADWFSKEPELLNE